MLEIPEAFAQFMKVESNRMCIWRRRSLRRALHGDSSFANEEVAGDRDQIGTEIEKKHATEMNMVVDEADDGAGDEPSTLNSSHEKVAGRNILRFRREFLNERSHGWPEHPEAGSD